MKNFDSGSEFVISYKIVLLFYPWLKCWRRSDDNYGNYQKLLMVNTHEEYEIVVNTLENIKTQITMANTHSGESEKVRVQN